jgi:hypothetical protein
MPDLPYRRNVGAALFNREGRVLIARRADLGPDVASAWQLPQGGLDDGEDARAAVLRELSEEIGTDKAEIVGEVDDWLHYDLPPELVGKALRGKYRGRRRNGSPCGSRGRMATSGWTRTPTRNSMRGGGRICPNCRGSRWRSGSRSMRGWWRNLLPSGVAKRALPPWIPRWGDSIPPGPAISFRFASRAFRRGSWTLGD